MSNNHVNATFLPSGKKIDVPLETTLIKAANDAGIEVNAVCGGKGTCGKCRAKIIEGVISEATRSEVERLSLEELKKGYVLLCQRKILGDVILETMPDHARQDDYKLSKGKLLDSTLEVASPVSKTYHQLNSPTIKDQVADLDRMLNQLPRETKVNVKLITRIPSLFRDAGYRVTSVVQEDELIALEKGNTVSEMYGVALDVGTTSVAGYLVDLADGKVNASISAANRQRVHGADVISRITYTMEDNQGLAELQKLIAQTIDEIVSKLLRQSGVAAERIYVLTLIGNTVMSHLLLGVSPAGIASAPFVPAFSRSLRGSAEDLGLKSLPPYTRFVLLPNVAGYVGSDTIGVILATKIYDLPGAWLAVDIGTNGEIVLASDNRLLTCSTAAGPAFEGACISHGMRAEPGAIYKVQIENDVDLAVIGDTKPVGICGSGLIDAVSEMIRLGIVKSTGRIKNPQDLPPGFPAALIKRIEQSGNGYKFVLAEGEQEIAITQDDINKLQLGKGAVRAGIEILLNELKLKPSDLDGILLAGAFGSNLRPASLKGIGMLPDVAFNRIKSVGNAAGTGAILALLSKRQMEIASALPARIEHVELSLHQGFQRAFARGLSFEVRKSC
jgi:uncharacterized 2Fe-2S/4Fe-4S cluster protein (DUF4445 family)